jgi:GTP-binding protein
LQLNADREAQTENLVANDNAEVINGKTNDDDWMFSDRARVRVKAGDGGNGCVSFNMRQPLLHKKAVPLGGSGGRGGSVYLVGDEGLNAIHPLGIIQADRGQHGMGSSKDGVKGKDAYARVPLGTVIRDAKGNLIGEVLVHEQKVRVARGGRGGFGNKALKTDADSTPTYAENGEHGGSREIFLELKLVADVALVGSPNAGKSTLLDATTGAAPKIASYPFTTVVPNLGVWLSRDKKYSFLIADVPGLLPGAHQGVGMGTAFLRHIQRCKLLVHIVDGSSEDPVGEFTAVRRDLEGYSPTLANKPYIIVINKIDIPEVRENEKRLFKQLRIVAGHNRIMPISAAARENCEVLMHRLNKLLLSIKDESLMSKISDECIVDPDEDSLEYNIERVSHGEWRVTCSHLEALAEMTQFGHPYSEIQFQRNLTDMGIRESLVEAGARFGDTIRIGDCEIMFFEESSTMAARARLAGFVD